MHGYKENRYITASAKYVASEAEDFIGDHMTLKNTSKSLEMQFKLKVFRWLWYVSNLDYLLGEFGSM